MTEDRPTTDGGETTARLDVQRAGSAPPDPPTGDGMERELPDLLGDVESVGTVHLVRSGFADGSGRTVGERLVTALEDKVSVVGSTLEAGFDPTNPELDVLVETEHDPGAIATSLASVGPVDGVVVADVTVVAERVLEADEADTADANDVFNDLKQEVGQEGYGTVVNELEDVSFPGGPDPDEEVDLESEAGVDLSGDDQGTLELDGDDDTLNLDDDDDVSTKELLGEEERTADTEVKTPDEKAIEEAIEDVELGAGTDDIPSDSTTEVDPLDGGSATDEQPAVESPPAGDPSAGTSDPADGSSQGFTGDTPGELPAGASGEMDEFVTAFVEALESGAVDDQKRTELREALGIESTHSLDVRLEYLQKRVDNLAAYTDAWEAFLSDQGSGRDFMESMKGDLAAIEKRLDAVEGDGDDLEGATARLADIEQQLSQLGDGHDDDIARLDTRMDNVESKLASRVDTVEDALEALTEKVSTLLKWREHVDDVLGK